MFLIKPHFSARRDGATKRIVLRGSTQVFQLQLSTWKHGLFYNIGQCVKLCKLLAHNGHAMTCPFRNKQSLYYVIYTCRILYRGQMSIICFWLDLPQSTSHCQHNKNWRTLECPLKHRVYSCIPSKSLEMLMYHPFSTNWIGVIHRSLYMTIWVFP